MGKNWTPSRRTVLRLGTAGLAGAVGYSATAAALENELRIAAVGESASYDFAVSGDLEPGNDFDEGTDSISGSSGSGTIGGRGSDDFTFSGEVTDFSSEGPLRVFVNGEEVDPASLGSGGDDGGSDAGDGGSGEDSDRTELIVSDPDGGQPNDYRFTVSGGVERLDDPQGDSADGDSGSGTVYGGADGYSYSGEITSFSAEGDVTVTIDGTEVDPASLGSGDGDSKDDPTGGDDPSRELRVEAVGESARFEVTVSGDLEPEPDFDEGTDSISGSSAVGTIGGRGTDDFAFSGEIADFYFEGPLRVFVDGTEVDPASLGESSGGSEEPGGGSGSKVLVVSDPDGSQPNDYRFSVSGDLEALDDPRGDDVDGDVASGTVYGGSDGYSYSGETTSFSYDGEIEVTIDGEAVDPDALGSRSDEPDSGDDRSDGDSTRRELVVSDPDGGQPNDYRFTVSGEVKRLDDPRGDDAEGDSASGTVYGGSDGYSYSGEVVSFSADGDVVVTIDGKAVDPATLGEGIEESGSRTLRIEAVGESASYDVAVSGDLEPGNDFDSGTDSISGSSGAGTVGGRGVDDFVFSGEILSFSAEGPLRTFLDGEEIDPTEIDDGDASGSARVIISFDDSVPTAKSVAKPIMDRYGYPGVVGIVTGRTQRSGEDGQLTIEELEELRDDDWEVASHTIDHTKLTEVSNSEIRRQARESKEFIDENDLSPPDPTIIYPYGGVDDRVVDVVEEYYEYGFGGEEDPTDGIDDPMRIDRSRGHRPAEVRRQIDEAIANGSEGVAILMFHRIGTFDDPKQNDTSKDAFADLMAYIDDRSEDLDIITTSEL